MPVKVFSRQVETDFLAIGNHFFPIFQISLTVGVVFAARGNGFFYRMFHSGE